VLPLDTWLLFCLACIVLAITPGPSIVYLVSRTLAQGRVAGLRSLVGTSAGFAIHALAAAFGLSALLAAVPLAFEVVRWAGAAYLAWLAVTTWRSGNEGLPAPGDIELSAGKLIRDGLLTSVLNPKVALFQLALFPQFVTPGHGSVLAQSLALAATQFAIVVASDSMFVLFAAGVRRWLGERPAWTLVSRRALAGVFGLLAARLAWQDRP
jgi:threonine/homoserine/homoserine lactone efflux protein